jgi:lysine 6-dehydrogenase
MARILVLGGAGEMGSVAVSDLVARGGHEVVVGDLRVDAAGALGEGVTAIRVDVEDADALVEAMRGADVVLSATFMRHNVAVTRAAIRAGVHLVDLGAYWRDTADQLELDGQAREAGVRVVAGCGVAPGLTNVLARHAADRLDEVRSVRFWSFITHPLWTSPGIVYTRLDASVGTALVLVDGRHEERPCFGDEELVGFPEPYGPQLVHLVPHPEPLTLPRSLDVRNVVFKVGYPPEETARIRALLELGFDDAEPFPFGGTTIVPRDFAAAFAGRRGLRPGERTANVKRVVVDGLQAGEPVTLTYDVAVESEDGSASSRITGTTAAICADLVARGAGVPGVHAPEGALEPESVLEALRARGIEVREARTPSVGPQSPGNPRSRVPQPGSGR